MHRFCFFIWYTMENISKGKRVLNWEEVFVSGLKYWNPNIYKKFIHFNTIAQHESPLFPLIKCDVTKIRFQNTVGETWYAWRYCTEAYSQPCQTSKMERLSKIVKLTAESKTLHLRWLIEFWICLCCGILNSQDTAWKESVFGVFLVRIFPHSDWIRKGTSFRIQSKCGKIQTKKYPGRDTFYAVRILMLFLLQMYIDEHLWWNFLQKYLTALSRYLFSQQS